MQLADTSKPALAVGCKWGGTAEEPLVLFPEGAIKVHGTGFTILSLCNGTRTFAEILVELQRQYFGANAQRIRDDATSFLEKLHEKRIVDF